MRFTRDVDRVVLVADDDDAERLIFELRSRGYSPVATVEHKRHNRLALARLVADGGGTFKRTDLVNKHLASDLEVPAPIRLGHLVAHYASLPSFPTNTVDRDKVARRQGISAQYSKSL